MDAFEMLVIGGGIVDGTRRWRSLPEAAFVRLHWTFASSQGIFYGVHSTGSVLFHWYLLERQVPYRVLCKEMTTALYGELG